MKKLAREIDQIVNQYIDSGSVSGAITLLSHQGDVQAHSAYGFSEFDPSFKIEKNSVMAMFSMTKPVIAACASALVAEGKMALSDPVSNWIPAFSEPRLVRSLAPGELAHAAYMGFGPRPEKVPEYVYEPAEREITVHDLMNFTSGLQTIGIYNEAIPDLEATDSLASWVDKLANVPLEFQPGAQWHYSNATGYDVLGRILEVVSGQTLRDLVAQRIFDPLGMKDSDFGLRAKFEDRALPLGPFANTPVARPDYPSGSAGLFSTAEDYRRFAQMLLDDGRYLGQRVLPREAIQMMKQNQIGDLGFPGVRAVEYGAMDGAAQPGLSYGYGLALVTEASANLSVPKASYGWDGIGTRRFWVIPEFDLVLIMLMTGLGPVADQAHIDIERAVCGYFS